MPTLSVAMQYDILKNKTQGNYKQHLKRHSLWAFEHQQLIEITYQDEAVNKISV